MPKKDQDFHGINIHKQSMSENRLDLFKIDIHNIIQDYKPIK